MCVCVCVTVCVCVLLSLYTLYVSGMLRHGGAGWGGGDSLQLKNGKGGAYI